MLFCFSTSHQFRVTALLAYGLLAACCAVGIKGVGVVLGHLGLSLTVAQLCNPALSWSCALLLLSTLHIPPLQEIQVSRTSFYSISCVLSLSFIHPLQEIHTSLLQQSHTDRSSCSLVWFYRYEDKGPQSNIQALWHQDYLMSIVTGQRILKPFRSLVILTRCVSLTIACCRPHSLVGICK